jgi:hypothetical protein
VTTWCKAAVLSRHHPSNAYPPVWWMRHSEIWAECHRAKKKSFSCLSILSPEFSPVQVPAHQDGAGDICRPRGWKNPVLQAVQSPTCLPPDFFLCFLGPQVCLESKCTHRFRFKCLLLQAWEEGDPSVSLPTMKSLTLMVGIYLCLSHKSGSSKMK